VDRKTFDRTLFEHAGNAGAAAYMSSHVVSAERRAGSWMFNLHTRTRDLTGRAKWIIAATGRCANTPFAPSRSRVWVDGLVAIAFRDASQGCRYDNASSGGIVEATPHGWWYSVRIPDGSGIAIFFTDADLLPKGKHDRTAFLSSELAQAPLTTAECEFVTSQIAQHRWTGFDARSSIRHVVISDGWTSVGDAIMAFDPLCGRGISEAINSGIEVADWLLLHVDATKVQSEALPTWIQRAASCFNNYRNERLSTYSNEIRWPTFTFWRRRRAL
jgi:2-polyprenyl-6-methoxyphenol hydroxylase-like FAD-dependent oxidoreductase